MIINKLMYIAQKIKAKGEGLKNKSELGEEYAQGCQLVEQATFFIAGLKRKIPLKWEYWAKSLGEEYDRLTDEKYCQYLELRKKYEGY